MGDTINRELTVKGQFSNAVIINDTLINGYDCEYDNNGNSTYSHAEGYKSKANGLYSHAEGCNANSNDNYSFVWSGVSAADDGVTRDSNGSGTFSLYTSGYTSTIPTSAEGLQNVFINRYSLYDINTYFKNEAIDTIRNSDNIFIGNLTLNSAGKRFTVNSPLTANADATFNGNITTASNKNVNINGVTTFSGNINLNGNVTAASNKSVTLNGNSFATTQTSSTCDTHIATCAFVHTVVREYLKKILGDSIFND